MPVKQVDVYGQQLDRLVQTRKVQTDESINLASQRLDDSAKEIEKLIKPPYWAPAVGVSAEEAREAHEALENERKQELGQLDNQLLMAHVIAEQGTAAAILALACAVREVGARVERGTAFAIAHGYVPNEGGANGA